MTERTPEPISVEEAREQLGVRNDVEALHEAMFQKMLAEQWKRRAESAENKVASERAAVLASVKSFDNGTFAAERALAEANANIESMRADSSKNKAYREVAEMASALAHLFPSWVLIDPLEPDWPVLYAQLPSGQVSWHFSQDDLDLIADIPRGGEPWDGHTREQRSERLAAIGQSHT